MNIAGLDKAEVLMVLFNRAKQQGMGFLDQSGAVDITVEEARAIIKEEQTPERQGLIYFDYLRGRVMKIDLSCDEVRTSLYNRDNGPDAAENAISVLIGKPGYVCTT